MDERPKVGVGVIVRKGNTVLLGKRKGSHGSNTWAFPGGHLEFMEELDDCVRREIAEEVSITVGNIRFGALTNDRFPDKNKHYITIFMVCDYESGHVKVMEPKKCEQWEWFTWDDLPQPLFLTVQNLLKQNYNPF